MNAPRISLDQWRTLAAVVDAGGYAQAAERLYKSQSAITYAVQKMETLLGAKLFAQQGRRAVLTPTGELLLRRARALIAEAAALERAAGALAAGWEAEIRLAVEVVFPTEVLLAALARFGETCPDTRIELIESVLGGTAEALTAGRVELAIGPQVPPGVVGEPLPPFTVVPVAHPGHPLFALGRELALEDLRPYRQLVVRDTGSDRAGSTLALEARQRWTVSSLDTSILAAVRGYGYGWYPEDKIRAELARGELAQLPLAGGGAIRGTLYLMFADRDASGPGVRALATCLRDAAASLVRAQG